MGLGAIGAFAQGFADSRNMVKDREERKKNGERQDRLIDALGAVPPGGDYRSAESSVPYYNGGGPGGDTGNGMGTAPPSGGTSGEGDLFSLIDTHEGGGNYDTLFGHSQNGGRFNGVRVSEMTVGEALEFANPRGEYGQWVKSELGRIGQRPRIATPMGRHQIVGTTLRGAVEDLNLPMNARFDRTTQDLIARHLAGQRLGGASTPQAKRAGLRAEWEGFRNVSDADLDRAISLFEQQGGLLAGGPMGAVRGTGGQS